MLTTHHSRAAVAALLVASALRAGAQAPVVTASGDPSLRSDSIYKLAIDKPEYPDQSTLVLLDDGIVRLEKDGRASRTYHQIIQILAEKAVENYQEHSFSGSPAGRRSASNGSASSCLTAPSSATSRRRRRTPTSPPR